MADNNHQLLVTIGAALSSSFNSVISGSTSKIKQIGGAFKDLEKNSLITAQSMNTLRTRYNSLVGSINKQKDILSKRANYKSQILGIVALGAAFAAPTKAAMDFEDSLARIKAVVNFKEPKGLQKLGDTLIDISKRVPKTVDELANIASIGGRFGVAEEELATFSEEVGKTMVAWRMDTNTGAEAIGNLMKAYKISTKELPQYFDVINHLGNTTGATADEILKSVVKASAGLSNFKLSIPQVAALTSTIKSLDKTGADAGQTVNQMIVRLSSIPKLGKDGQEAFHKMGLGVHGFTELMMEDPQKAIDTLLDALSKLEGKDRLVALDSIFGKRVAQQVGNLVDKLDLYKHNLDLVADPEVYKGSRDGDYQIVLDETRSKLDLLKNSFSALVIQLGTALLPMVQSLADKISSVINPIQEWMRNNEELVGQITTVVGELIGFKIAAFALGFAWTYVAGAWNTVVIGLKALRLGLSMTGVALQGFMGWPAAIAAAIIGAGYLIWDNWEAISDFFADFWEPIKPYWDEFVSFISELAVTQFIIDAWESVKEFFTGLWDSVSPYLSEFTDFIAGLAVTQLIISAWKPVEEFFSGLWDSVSSYLTGFTDFISELEITEGIISAWEAVGDFFSGLWDEALDAWNNLVEKITENKWVQLIVDSFKGIAEGVSILFTWISDKWKWATEGISNFFKGGIFSRIGNLFSSDSSETKERANQKEPEEKNIGSVVSSKAFKTKEAMEKEGIFARLDNLFSKKTSGQQLKVEEVRPSLLNNVERTQNNNFTINVQVDKKDDANKISKKIVNAVSAHEKTFLFDPVPKVI